MKAETVILVHSTTHAIFFEKQFSQAGITCQLAPVPRQLSSDCGVCVRFSSTDLQRVQAIVKESGIEIQALIDLV
jgi:predicted DNA binding CopG/RHH family protein